MERRIHGEPRLEFFFFLVPNQLAVLDNGSVLYSAYKRLEKGNFSSSIARKNKKMVLGVVLGLRKWSWGPVDVLPMVLESCWAFELVLGEFVFGLVGTRSTDSVNPAQGILFS